MTSFREDEDRHIRDQRAAVIKVIRHMRRDLSRSLPLVAAAHIAQFSPFHFHRLFVRETGATPARFLTALRMAEARRLLLRSRLTVTAVSAQVGYASVGTFITQFHRSVGLPPARFRRLFQEFDGVLVADLMPVFGRWASAAETTRCPFVRPDGTDRPGLALAEVAGTGQQRDSRWWTAAPTPRRVPVPRAGSPGDHVIRVLVLPADRRVADVLVDSAADGLMTGQVRVRESPDRPREGWGVGVPVRSLRPTDPPMLSAAPARWLRDVMRERGHGESPLSLQPCLN